MPDHTKEGSVHILTMRNEQNLLNPPFVSRFHEELDEVEADSEGESGPSVGVFNPPNDILGVLPHLVYDYT